MRIHIPLDNTMTDQEVLDALHQGAELARRLRRVDQAFQEAHPDGVIDEANSPADQQPVDVTENPRLGEVQQERNP